MKLSVVIPCYNAAETIAAQLEAISKQQWNYPWEVIIADNGSSDNTVEIVKEFEGKISNLITVDASEKKGPSYARNFGVENSNGEYIAFMDADDIVGKNWLQNIGNALLKHDFVACRLDWTMLNDLSDDTLQKKPQLDGLINFSMGKFLPFANGGSLGIKKSVHDKVNGYDESLKYSEDLDYCWRVQLEGHKLIFILEAMIQMRSRSTNKKVFKQHMKWGEGDVYLLKKYKHHGIEDYTTLQSIRSLYHVLRTWRNLFSPEKKELWIIRFGQRLGRLKGMIKYKYLKMGPQSQSLQN